jgi:anti-sigma factor RsiW
MKSCLKNREPLALLAMDALDIQRERELRAHLENCAECRGYLAEISAVAGRLRAAEPKPDGELSESFHRNLMGVLGKAKRESAAEMLAGRIWPIWNWRVVVPAVAIAVVMIAEWLVVGPRAHPPAPPAVLAAATSSLKADLEPTFANYEMAIHQSLDKLDDLLTQQGNQSAEPSTIYAATQRPVSNLAD